MRSCNELTKQMLLDLGVISVNWIPEENRYEVVRLWRRGKKKAKPYLTKIKPCATVSRRVFAPDGVGYNVCLFGDGHQHSFALGKFVYA